MNSRYYKAGHIACFTSETDGSVFISADSVKALDALLFVCRLAAEIVRRKDLSIPVLIMFLENYLNNMDE